MNDLGEAFFSSPMDPTDVRRDWGRSDNDQRHRLVLNDAPPGAKGFQLSSIDAVFPRRCRSTSPQA